MKAKTKVCNEILEIAEKYHGDCLRDYSLSDVWSLILKWEEILKKDLEARAQVSPSVLLFAPHSKPPNGPHT